MKTRPARLRRRPPTRAAASRARDRVGLHASAVALSLVMAACPGPDAQARVVNDRDTMTVRQRDSVTATLPIPGARGVGGALNAADRANARADRHDALLRGSPKRQP